MIERLDRAFQQQQRFTADASHELRTPLTVIRSLADVALSSPPNQAYDRRHWPASVRRATASDACSKACWCWPGPTRGQALMLDAVDLDDLLLDAAERTAPRALQQGVHLRVVPTDGERRLAMQAC